VAITPRKGDAAGPAIAVEDAMRARAHPYWMLAVFPWIWDAGPLPLLRDPPPCAIAIEVDIKAPLVFGTLELHVMSAEVERVWAPYGVTFCWTRDAAGCSGLEVRLRVLVAESVVPPGLTGHAGGDVLGWIPFVGDVPGTGIEVSVRAARTLVDQARVGFRPLAAWPAAVRERYVPIVLGRGLAHEIGHYVLRSREHTRTGLMAAAFQPDRVTLEAVSRFGLTAGPARALRAQCGTALPRFPAPILSRATH